MTRRWRVVLLRNKGETLGQDEAPDVASAKAAAVDQLIWTESSAPASWCRSWVEGGGPSRKGHRQASWRSPKRQDRALHSLSCRWRLDRLSRSCSSVRARRLVCHTRRRISRNERRSLRNPNRRHAAQLSRSVGLRDGGRTAHQKQESAQPKGLAF